MDMGLYSCGDREADMREVNLNVDYGFEGVSEIRRRFRCSATR